MATVIETKELWRGVGGRYGGPTEMNYVRRFRLTTDERTTDPDDILESGALPPLDSDSKCGRRVVGYNWDISHEAPLVWFVEVEYSDRPRDLRKVNYNPDPRLRPLVVEIAPTERQKAIERTPNGDWITNSAGDPFERGVVIDDARLVFRCKKNISPIWGADGTQQLIDEAKSMGNNNCVNSDRISFSPDTSLYGEFVFNEKQVLYKFRGLSEVREEACVQYQEWTYELHVATTNDGVFWERDLLDIGYNEKRLRVGKQRIVLSDGRHPTVPQLLDGDGHWLGPEATRQQAKSIPYDVYKAVPFGTGWLPGVTD
jgi:hypothetical protein